MKVIRTLIPALLLLAATASAKAELSTKYPCTDGMVLQQQCEALVWGHSSPGADLRVKPSWGRTNYKVKADSTGTWRVYVSTPKAGYEHYSIDIKGDGGRLTISDVLVGEVWIAGGQSNMAMPMVGYYSCPVEGVFEELCTPSLDDKIRYFRVEQYRSFEPVDDIDNNKVSGWLKTDASCLNRISATAFFFARQLNRMLDVPVGIVAIPYGGTRVESWLPKSTVAQYEGEPMDEAEASKKGWLAPYMMYNAMQHPVQGYTAKGFIWYQGCSNVGHHEEFVPRMTELIRQWRSDWGDEGHALPFYMVEIAPYNYGSKEKCSGALLRSAQHEVAERVENCGIVVTNDLVYSWEERQIHPSRKREVGERLAALALNRDYAVPVPCYSPVATRIFRFDNEIGIELANCGYGISRLAEIQGLEIAGPDGEFKPVDKVRFNNGALLIKCDNASLPCTVRYGWGDFKPGNLQSTEGLPLAPFCLTLE